MLEIKAVFELKGLKKSISVIVETFPGDTQGGGWALTVIDRLIESVHC